MSSSDLCPDCKEGRLVDESIGTEDTKTCTNCGFSTQSANIVIPTFAFQEGYTLSTEGSLEQKYNCKVDSSYKQPSKNKKEVLNKMKNYLKQYPSNDNLYESVSTMYLKTIEKRHHIYRKMRLKNALAVACMVIVLRNSGISVLIPKLCEDFEIDVKRVMQFIAELKPKDEVNNASDVDIQTFVDNIFERHSDLKQRKSLKDCTLKLFKLFYDLHLHTTRPLLASVSLYFALLSETPGKRWMTTSEYCKKYNMEKSRSFDNYCALARTKIFLLAKRLPWAPSSIAKFNCHHHIKDILKAKHSLCGSDFGLDSQIPLEKNIFKGRKVKTRCSGSSDHEKRKVEITEQHILQLPSASIRNFGKVPKPAEPADPVSVPSSETIGEDEMSENELKHYIRTPEEVEVAKKIRKMTSN